MVEPPGTAPGSAVPIAHHNLSPYPVETGTPYIGAPAQKERDRPQIMVASGRYGLHFLDAELR